MIRNSQADRSQSPHFPCPIFAVKRHRLSCYSVRPMTRISIHARDLESSISATLEPGRALLIGRAPDPSRIDWGALLPQQAPCALMNPRTEAACYRVETFAVQSGRTSANHLLVLQDAAVTALYDLGSRNGSWVKLGPQRPIVMTGGFEVSISLAGTPTQESRLSRPKAADWREDEDFGTAVVRAIDAWLLQIDAPVHVVLKPVGSATSGFLLADDRAIELHEHGTLQLSITTLFELVSEYIHDQNVRWKQLQRRVSGMVTGSAVLREILSRTAEAAASSRRTIFLGPTGVGKELLARSYHGYSPRHSGPFVTVNCALLEKDLLYAQLFGARRGSFTGAIADVVGLIETADGGTLFLDELGELSPDVQKALLRFLDSRGEYYRLGEPRARHADIQLVCASNAPLDDPGYRSARFRDDLWYRLAASVIAVPPLCERPDDIRAFLSNRVLHGGKRRIVDCLTEEALDLVLKDPWPGNFRDLENFVARLPPVAGFERIDRARCEQATLEGRPKAVSASPTTPVPASPVPASPAPASSAPAPASSAPSLAASADLQQAPPPKESPIRPTARLRAAPSAHSNTALGWERIMHVTLSAFLEDHGEEQAGWDQLHLLIERYLKPMFVAHGATLKQVPIVGCSVNYSALARKLHIADGSTVKTHLTRFEERLAAMAPLPLAHAGAPSQSKAPDSA